MGEEERKKREEEERKKLEEEERKKREEEERKEKLRKEKRRKQRVRVNARAKYRYKSTKHGHVLSFSKGDIINVRKIQDKDWWYGVNTKSSKGGWFPAAYF